MSLKSNNGQQILPPPTIPHERILSRLALEVVLAMHGASQDSPPSVDPNPSAPTLDSPRTKAVGENRAYPGGGLFRAH